THLLFHYFITRPTIPSTYTLSLHDALPICTAEGVELTTSAALMLTTFTGVLAGQGQTFTPTVLGVTTAALLAWKTPLAGFSAALDRKSTRLNSSHVKISYADFCLKKKNK